MTTLEAACQYLARHWQPLPIFNGKDPSFSDWQHFQCTVEDVDQHFTSGGNIGLLLGDPSEGLVDVDLDSAEAVAMAPALLPATALLSGREGNPHSHYWYLVDPPTVRTMKFQYRLKGSPDKLTIVELRATGGQTVVAPSRHPDGDHYLWHSFG